MGSSKDDLKLGVHTELYFFYSLKNSTINQDMVLFNSSKREY